MYKDSQQIPTFVLHVLCMTKYSYTLSFNLSFYILCPCAIYLFRCAGFKLCRQAKYLCRQIRL